MSSVQLSKSKKQKKPSVREWWIPKLDWVRQQCPICGELFDRKKGSPQKCCRNINCRYEYAIRQKDNQKEGE